MDRAISLSNTRITANHLSKIAYVYIRQSSLAQVKQNQESTSLQYQLVERAVNLGWPRERIQIIDEDLGKSGKSSQDRVGFKHLIVEIGLARAGLVISLDASRLARNNKDWYQLLELCSLFGVLLADAEKVYDPRSYHDRMLLGLSGIMSEAELHHLKMRLENGRLNKAERAELVLPLPPGLARTISGEVVLNPDEEVQQRIKLVFEKFGDLSSAKAVMRYLRQAGLGIPISVRGYATREIVWRQATSCRVLRILKNPAYAGAYVYGRSTSNPNVGTRSKPGQVIAYLKMSEWLICVKDIYPAYISWEEFLANQEKLSNNINNYRFDKKGAVRGGKALLAGIVFCGLCGRRMKLHYSGRKGDVAVYICDTDRDVDKGCCQKIRAWKIDQQLEEILLAALSPSQIELALAALEELEQEAKVLKHQWDSKRERANYEAEKARRQYDLVEPENRLVARNLERAWEDKLRKQEEVEQEYQNWLMQNRAVITQADKEEVIAIGKDFPQLWYDDSTSISQRKEIIRLVIKEVFLDQKRFKGQVWMKINWQTGASTEHLIKRRVSDYKEYADLEKVKQKIIEMKSQEKLDKEIAQQLNKEGFLTARGRPFNGKLVQTLRDKWTITSPIVVGKKVRLQEYPEGVYTVSELVQILDIGRSTIYRWIKEGFLQTYQICKSTSWKIFLSDQQLNELKSKVTSKINQKRRHYETS